MNLKINNNKFDLYVFFENIPQTKLMNTSRDK